MTLDIPEASRPYIPGYGLPTTRKGLLDWSHVVERLRDAETYWMTTADENGHPRTKSVPAGWRDDRLEVPGSAVGEDEEVAIFVGHGTDAVVLEGTFHPGTPTTFLQPRVVFAWTDFTKDMTRWRFEDG